MLIWGLGGAGACAILMSYNLVFIIRGIQKMPPQRWRRVRSEKLVSIAKEFGEELTFFCVYEIWGTNYV